MQGEPRAPNSCRTCRQRRVKCDRLLPTCRHCASLKLRCLGYKRKKALVWTNSMASRGKMMGKATFDTGSEAQNNAAQQQVESPIEMNTARNELVTTPPSIEWSLLDPSLQDIPKTCRDYIRYFDLELSKECVVYNNTSTNPFLALMPLIPWSQALSYLIVSISAFHLNHRLIVSQTQFPSNNPPTFSNAPEPWYLDHNYDWHKRHTSYGTVLRTAISSKQQALQCIKHELRIHPEENSDAVIAAVLLFVNLDVVEYGGRGWKYHLRGAEELVRTRKALIKDETSDSANRLRYFDTACTTFGILGGTLVPLDSLSPQASTPFDSTFLDTLGRSEHQTWIGCPADLLSLLHVMNTIRTMPNKSSQLDEIITMLLDGLETFSPSVWANNFPDPQHYQSRYLLAYAYRAAIGVYASHIIGTASNHPSLCGPHILDLTQLGVLHMLQIPANDFHIKSLVWPAFILGAETRCTDLRQKVQVILHNIWVSSCCYNVRTAAETLDMIWGRSQDDNAGKSWLNYIWEQDESWLFL